MSSTSFLSVDVQNGTIMIPQIAMRTNATQTSEPRNEQKLSSSEITNQKIQAIALACLALLAIAFSTIILLACIINPLIGCGIIAITIGIIAICIFAQHNMNNAEDKMLYHKVLDASDCKKRTELDRNPFSTSIKSIKNDLEKYLNELEEKNEVNDEKSETYKIYNDLIAEFSFAKEIAENDQLPFLSHSAVALKIKNRLDSISNGEGVLIPGGFKSHAALYYIQKNEDNSFNFTLLNTGAGCTFAKTLIDKNGVDYQPKKEHIVDITYTKIEAEKLSPEFFKKLLLTKKEKDMTSAKTLIDTQFGGRLNIRIGNTHKYQRKGICTMKCSFIHIRNRLGLDEYRKFKVFITKDSIDKFKEFKAKPFYRDNQVYNEMLNEAEKVQKRREERVKKTEPKKELQN